jgi:hypothetical protein
MPTPRIPPDLDLNYLVDNFTDPWSNPGATPASFSFCTATRRTARAWYEWLPQLAHRYRVVRPDSAISVRPVHAAEYPWTRDGPIDDFSRLMDTFGRRALPSRGRQDRRHRHL